MKYIGEEDTQKYEEQNELGYMFHLDGFDQLIEAYKNGEFAVWEYAGVIMTTDDIPEDYEHMEHSEIVRQMKHKAFERYERLENIKNKDTGIHM